MGQTSPPGVPIEIPARFADGFEIATARERPTILRRLTAADAEAFAKHVRSDIERLGRYLPWPAPTSSVEGAQSWLEAYEQFRDGRVIVLGAWDGQELLGGVLLFHHDRPSAALELGCWVVASAERKGVTSAGARTLIAFARNALAVQRIEWRASTLNVASRRLAEHLGFKHEGTLRSSYVLREERLDIDVFAMVQSEIDTAIADPPASERRPS
jgi:ribosomal-protein-serine acetyltransferase